MVKDQPLLNQIKKDVFNFIGQDIIIGHHTSFDLNFIVNHFQKDLENEYIDTVRLS